MKITEESMKQQTPQETSPRPETPERTEREKLKNMSRQDQLWYIWAYYKFHIIAVVMALVVLQIIVSSLYRNSFDTVLHCIYVNSRSTEDVNPAPLEEDFAAWLGLGKKELITTETAFISFGEDATDFSYANMAKISALVSTQDLDVLICDKESLDHYASLDGFVDLEQGLSPETLALVQNRLYRCPSSDGVTHAFAIDLSGTDFVAQSNLAQTPPLFGIIVNSAHTENAEALIRYIFAR